MKKSIFVVTLLAGSFSLNAAVLDPAAALERVGKENISHKISAKARGGMKLVATKNAGEHPAVYIFADTDRDNNFMVVSADDVAPALLGYGDGNVKSNPAFDEWMNEYARQIEWARSHGMSSVAAKAPERNAIAPLVTTKWDQGEPYNDMCPIVRGARSVTGCTATALAQVLKYHNWPLKGEGSYSYKLPANGNTLSIDFSNTEYDWANMLDVYDGKATEAQRKAVANLMLSCGVVADMDYTPEASGAYTANAARGIARNLRYDRGVLNISRDYYGLDEWNDLIYDQLVNYGPVEYSGANSEAGHAFVCDGYSSDNFFHINWGWGGISDGYFLLTALDPSSQGIGGSNDGYNFWQQVIVNIKPASNGNPGNYTPYFLAESFDAECITVDNTDNNGFDVSYINVNSFYYNSSIVSMTGKMGIKAVNEAGKIFYLSGSDFENLGEGYGYESWYVESPENLPKGSYSVSPVVNVDGKWYDVKVRTGAPAVSKLNVYDDTADFDRAAQASIELKDIDYLTPFYADKAFKVNFTVENNSQREYLGGVKLVLCRRIGGPFAYSRLYSLDVLAGESQLHVYEGMFSTSDAQLTQGNYNVYFQDEKGNRLSPNYLITLNVVDKTVLSTNDLSIVGGNKNVDPANIEFTANVKCEKGYFTNTLELPIWYGDQYITGFYASDLTIVEGETVHLTIMGSIENPVYGGTYNTMLFNHETWEYFGNYIEFTLSKSSGVDSVDSDHDVVSTEYYTLSGSQIMSSELQRGVYIVRETLSDGTVRVKKCVK